MAKPAADGSYLCVFAGGVGVAKHESVLIAYGWEFPCRRFVMGVCRDKRAEGWHVTKVSGTDREALATLMGGSSLLMSSGPTLAVITEPEKVPLTLLESYTASPDPDLVLLLYVEGSLDGRTKFGQWVKKQKSSKAFEIPKDYKLPEEAAKFAVTEATRHGKKLDLRLAEQLVERVGTDLGVVTFEIDKFVILANLEKSDSLTPKIINAGMASILPAMVGPVISALGLRQVGVLARALNRVYQSNKDDPTMPVCRFVGESATRWMQASHLDGVSSSEAAEMIGIHSWRYENMILPVARRWGRAGTVRLVKDLAATERALLSGVVSPWNVLSTRLLAACSAA